MELTEYEQLLVSAGWVDESSLDEKYQMYLNSPGPRHTDGPLGYEHWRETCKELQESSDAYLAEIQPLYDARQQLSHEQRRREDDLLRDMSFLEAVLGY